jgi:ADP-heptose:LPS heptosyltransferase
MKNFDLKKILIIKHGSLGDIISSTSAIKDIRNHYVNYRLFILTTNNYKKFFANSKLIDDILIDERGNLYESMSIIKKVINLRFDMIIDLQNSKRTSFYALIVRFFSKVLINGTGIFSTHRFKNKYNKLLPVIDGLSSQIEVLGIQTTRVPYLDWLNNNSFNFRQLKNQNFFIINPGCSQKNSQKKWAPINFASICTYLITKNILPILIGYDHDKKDIEEIEKKEPRVLNLFNKSPLDIIFQLSKKAIGSISNDTGPAHLIAASGCKLHLILSNFSNTNTVIPQGKNVSFTQTENINDILPNEIIKKLNQIFNI